MFSLMLGYINLEFLNPIINFLNAWYVPIITVLATGGIIYAIVLGINLAKSDNAEKRLMAKQRIIHASLTIVIIIALTFSLQFVLKNLDDWVNNSSTIKLTNTNICSQVYCYRDQETVIEGNTAQIENFSLESKTTTDSENADYVDVFVLNDISYNVTSFKLKFNFTETKYTVKNGEGENKNEITVDMSDASTYTSEKEGITSPINTSYKYKSVKVTIMNDNITLGYYEILLVTGNLPETA